MGGKGGGGTNYYSDPVQTYTDPVDGTTYNTPQELNDHITARKAEESATSAANTAADTAADTTAEQTFQTNRSTAYNDALAAINRKFQLQGADPNQYYESDIKPTLDRQYNSIQDLDPNPAAAFPTSLGDTIISDLISGKRTQATNSLSSVFTPTYSSSLIPDTADDPYVTQIVNEQFDPLSSQLTNALKRNTLTDTGYQAALDALTQKRSSALETVGNLGRGILSTDRSAIDDIISGAKTAASGIGLNDTFDPNTYATQATSRATEDLSNLGGALRNAVGGSKFADLQELINAGGAVQGANNPTATNPLGVGGVVSSDTTAEKKRGLGNAGVF